MIARPLPEFDRENGEMPSYGTHASRLNSRLGRRPDVWSARRALCFLAVTSLAGWAVILAALWLLLRA